MNPLEQETSYRLEERKRILRGVRNYDLYTASGTSPLYTIEEKANIFKKLSRFIFGESMAIMKFSVKNADGSEKFVLKKGFGPANMSSFKMLTTSGEMISRAANPIKFKDDSFIEIFDPNKEILFKSGLSHGRRWFPIKIYPAETVESNWLMNTISGEVYASISRDDNRIVSSGNRYSIDLAEAPKTEEALINIANFAITADFHYDHKNDG